MNVKGLGVFPLLINKERKPKKGLWGGGGEEAVEAERAGYKVLASAQPPQIPPPTSRVLEPIMLPSYLIDPVTTRGQQSLTSGEARLILWTSEPRSQRLPVIPAIGDNKKCARLA